MQTQAARSHKVTAGIVSAALVVVALAAYRATLGASFYDDSYYVTSAVRLAQGARLFVDEMSVQALGQLAVVPFVKLWTQLFGLSGIVLATRLLYVAVGTAFVALVSRLLRPSLTAPLTALALSVVLLAPPYNILAPSYDTITVLSFVLAVACCFVALRDDRLWLSAAGGAAAAFGSVAYPPLIFSAVALLITFGLLSRRRLRHIAAAAAGGVTVAGLATAYLLSHATIGDVRATLTYTSSIVGSLSSPLGHLVYVLGYACLALLNPLLLPMWALAVAACVPALGARVRALCMAAIPLAAAVPGLLLIAHGAPGLHFGTASSSWLLTCLAGVAAPSLVHAVRTHAAQRLRLLLLALPASIVGALVVAEATSSSVTRGVTIVGLAPLAFALLVCWAAGFSELGGRAIAKVGVVVMLVTALFMLYATVFDDVTLDQPRTLVTSGPYAGVTMGVERWRQIEGLVAAGRRFVGPRTTVVFLGQRAAYMLVGGRPYTNVTWLTPTRSDGASLVYYARHGGLPQIAFVDDVDIHREGGYARAPAKDPMLATVLRDYTLVGSTDGFRIYRLRP